MFRYQKRLIYPLHVEQPNDKLAEKLWLYCRSSHGKEMMFYRYLAQQIAIKNAPLHDLLGMIAAEELNHWEILEAAIYAMKETPWPKFKKAGTISNETAIDHPLTMLKKDFLYEHRAVEKWREFAELTEDEGVLQLLQFLEQRDETHMVLLEQAIALLQKKAEYKDFAALNHQYKLAWRVLQ